MNNKKAQKIITVASIAASKLEQYSIENDGEIIYSYDAHLIRLLSRVFQVRYKIVFSSDDEVCTELFTGNWSGMMGMVHRSEVDLAVNIFLTDQRFQVFNFSYPYRFTDATFMTENPKLIPTPLAVFHPFPLIMWVLLSAVILLFSFVTLLHSHKKHTFQHILFMLFGSLLEKPIDMKLRKLRFKLILSTWLVFSFFITNSYKVVLLSILTLPKLTGIRDIRDLAKAAEQNSIICYSYQGTALRKFLLESDIHSWRSIGNCLQRNVIISNDVVDAFDKQTSNKAFISVRSYLIPYKDKYFISEDSFFNSMYAFTISRNFCCQNYLNERIHRLFAAGVFQKIEKDEQFFLEFNMTLSASTKSGRGKVLDLDDLKGDFIVLFFGYALSTVVLCTEIAVKHFLQNKTLRLIH